MADILVIGSINVDHSLRVARHPRPGETVAGSGLQSAAGGKGANQAVAAARWTPGVRLVGAVGDDPAGAGALEALAQAGVETTAVTRLVAAATGQAFICVTPDGENTIVVAPGANAALTPGHLSAADFARATVVLCQLETPRETVEAALSHPDAHGAVKILNAAPCEPWAGSLIALCDMLIVNQTELELLAGGEVDPARAAARLGMRPDQVLVLTLGANGCAAWRGGAEVRVAGRPVQAVDATGAGDCFCGVLAAVIAEGQGLAEALALANIAASLSVQCAGAQAGMPTRSAILAEAQAAELESLKARGLTP